MNKKLISRFSRICVTNIILFALLFPLSFGMPLAALPVQAATAGSQVQPASGLPEIPPTPPAPGGLSNNPGSPASAPVVVTTATQTESPNKPADLSTPQPLVPSVGYPHLPAGYVSLGSFTAVGTVDFNTDALTYGGLPGGVVDSGNAVFAFSSINIPAGTTLRARGSRPLVLTTAGAVTINGTIDLNGTNSSPTAPSCTPGAAPNPGGAGGGAGGAGTAANPGVGLPGSGPSGGGAAPASSSPGAGGAGFGGNGGSGGSGGGAGGLTYGNLGVALQGGSGGGGASTNTGDGCQAAAGAGGGGALLITSYSTIQIGSTGVVSANGGNGALSDMGAPGAGSGGALILFAPAVVNAGIVRANGGSGGAGGCCGGGGGGGGGRLLVVSSYSGAGSTNANGGAGGSGNGAGAAGAAGQVQTFAYGTGPGVFQAGLTDLGMTKSLISPATPQVGIAGQEVIYQLDVHNFGPDVAVNALVTDTLPADVIFMGATLPCTDNAGVLTCSLGLMDTGASLSFQVKLYLPPNLVASQPDGTLEITNLAIVSSMMGDPNPFNDQASVTSQVQDLADLRVTKIIEPGGIVQAGAYLTHTVFVDNLGPSYARDVRFNDSILSDGKYQVVTVLDDPDRTDSCVITPGFGTQTSSTTINCTLINPLEPLGNSVQPAPTPNTGRWTVKIILRASTALDISGVTEVFTQHSVPNESLPGTPDPDTSNNLATSYTHVQSVADLQSFSVFGAEVQTNGLPGTIINTNSPPAMPDPACCNFGGTTVTAGRRIQWDTSTINAGPSIAQNTRIEVYLPFGASLIENTLIGLPNAGNKPGRCYTQSPGELRTKVICEYGGLFGGETASLRFQVLVDPNLPPGTQLSFDSFATSETFDTNLSNNLTSIQFDDNTWADLAVQKFGNPNPVPAGELTSYDITFQNKGPSLARKAILTDVLPPGFEPVGVSIIDGSLTPTECTIRSGDPALVSSVTCELGDLAAGASGRLVLSVRPLYDTSPGIKTNTVSISSSTGDPFLSDNTSTFTTVLVSRADLSISQTGEPAKVKAGEQVRYLLTVSNLGPSLASAVVATGNLPGGITFETGPASCLKTSTDPDVVTCTLGDLPPGTVQTFELWGLVKPDAPTGTNLVATASVTSDTSDPDVANNSASALTFIEGLADLRITKFGKPDDVVRAGSPLTYTVVVDNFGPSYAHEVTILDQLVASGGFELVDLQSDRQAVCDPPGPYASLGITCVLSDTLEPAGAGNVGRWIVTAVIIANEPGSINNLARVSSTDLDPDLSNNSAIVQHEISAVVDLQVAKTAVGEVLVNGELLQWSEDWPYGQSNLWRNLPIESWVDAGHILTYTLTITNNGPSTAQNIVLKDYLPAGVPPPGLPPTSTLPLDYEVQHILPSQGNCTWGVVGSDTKPLTCKLGSLPGGGAAQVQVVVHIPEDTPVGTTYYNEVQVYNDLFDPQNANDSDGLFTVVLPPVWLHYLPVINSFVSWP